MTITLFILVAVLFLAYSNGANDNFKGVATLFGSGTANYRGALVWATVTTLSGSLVAVLFASGLVDVFKGKGLVPDAVIAEPGFLLSISLGAALTVMLATWLGMPISTTHALTGSLVGAGLVAASGDVRLEALVKSFLVPLLCAPILALVATLVVYPLFGWSRRQLGVDRQSCLCVGTSCEPVSLQTDGSLLLISTGAVVKVGQINECVERYQGRMLGLEAGPVLDNLHFLTGGAVGFARGINDTPKIVALLLAGEVIHPTLGLFLVAIVMAVGGILNARRVAETMSRKITRMTPGQGFTANLVTAFLVTVASRFGLPVSTTHVSCGSLFGIGLVNGTGQARTILSILLAWITTLPTGAAMAAAVYWLQSHII